MPGSRPTCYLTHEYVGRDQTCGLQKLQVAPLAVPLFLEGRTLWYFPTPKLGLFYLDDGRTLIVVDVVDARRLRRLP